MTHEIKVKNRLGAYLYIFSAGLISTVVMRCVACFRDLDIPSGYFNNKGLITAADITMVAFMLILFLHTFSHANSDSTPKEGFANASTYIPLGGLAVAVLFLSFELAKECFVGSPAFSDVPGTVKLIAAILGLLSAATFTMNILIEKKLSQLRGAFSILTVLFFAMYSINVYFSTEMPANSPSKILSEFAFLFTAIFFLYETRISIGRSKWHSYTAFGLIATLILSYTAVPTLILYIFKGGALIVGSATELAAMLMLAIFIGARTMLITFAPEDEVCELADNIIDIAYERSQKASQSTPDSLARGLNLNVENQPQNGNPETADNSSKEEI